MLMDSRLPEMDGVIASVKTALWADSVLGGA